MGLDPCGRRVREWNNETAMELKAALDALLDGRAHIYAALDVDTLPSAARRALLVSLADMDEAIRRMTNGRYWTGQIEQVMAVEAQRGPYRKGRTGGGK
jgi:hypothetical protein